MALILALSTIVYVVIGVTSLATYFDVLTQQMLVITSTDVARFPEFSIGSLGSQIELASQIASSVAYLLTWIGTVKLLYPISKNWAKSSFGPLCVLPWFTILSPFPSLF
jgi:hypothetical protein